MATLSGIIQPRGFVVIDLNGSKLNNDGDLIALFDSAGLPRDQVIFGDWQDGGQGTHHAPVGGLDLSVARVFDGYDTNNDEADFVETLLPTKGGPNSIVSKKVTPPPVGTANNPTTSVPTSIPLLEFKNNNALATTSVPIIPATLDTQVTSLEVSVDTSAVGSTIAISGTVVVPPGIFGSQYFYLGSFDNERSTVNRGWQIYQNKKLFPVLSIGDKVSVTGEVTEIKSGRRLKVTDPSSIKLLGVESEIEPLPMTADQVTGAREGAIVVVEGEVTEVKSGHIFVDDGSGEIGIALKAGTGLSSKQFSIGDTVTIIGMTLKNTKGSVEVLPRGSDDISIIKHAVNKENTRVVSSKINSDTLVSTDTNQIIVATHNDKDENVVEKYLSAGATGLTSLLIGLLLKTRGSLLLAFLRRKE
jgi:DNA/RNA endonuclease YhcR with UshA esterase domain